jgi:serpin B
MHAQLRIANACLAGLALLLANAPRAAQAGEMTPSKSEEAAKPADLKKPAEPAKPDPEKSDDELPPGRVIFRQSKIEERIRKALDEPVRETIFSDTQLRDAANHFELAHKIPIAIDGEALGSDGKNDELELSLTIPDGASLRSALRSTLEPRGLIFTVQNDRLLITTKVAAETMTPQRVYQVHDLIAAGSPSPSFEWLIEILTSTITPESWREAGGTQGEVKGFHADGILVLIITQTEAVHEQVESLLTDIRAARDMKVRELQRKQLSRRDPVATQAEALRAALAARSADDKLTFPAPPACTELVAASNKFGLRLYRELAAGRTPEENLVVSPIGTVAALGPIYAGASGTTAKEFEAKLGLPPPAQFQSQFADLTRWMNDPTVLRSYRLRSRSHLFVQPSLRLTVGFVDTVRRSFDVTPVPLDFENREADAKAEIRKTAEADSGGFLDVGELMEAISKDTRLAVVNTVDFRGRWATPFPISATTVQPFRARGDAKQTNMMTTIEDLDYYESDELQMVRKPYDSVRDAGTVSLYILLPTLKLKKTDELQQLEANLTIEQLTAQIAEMTTRKVQLYLPRFTFDNMLGQTKPLQKLGLIEAFNEKADFSLINGARDLQLSSVEQKAKIEVNETETRAAATTIATMGWGGAVGPPQPEIPKLVRCDHPFLFLLRDDTTGAILFLGRLATPSAP